MMSIIIIVNILVGGLVGLTGVAGFLLPMLYVTLDYSVTEALALSFFAFFISGVIGSINYYKYGQLNIFFGLKLGISSLIGACIGVYYSKMIDENIIRLLLYMVVLFSGISILFRKDKEKNSRKEPESWKIVVIGIITAMICSLSGAGGPILVMPLLVVLGLNIKTAIALSLFDSIFIAIPSVIGYLGVSYSSAILKVLGISGLAHGIGVFLGSKYNIKVNQIIIKKSVAIISILIALYKLFL